MRKAATSLRIPWPEGDACRYARSLLLLFHIAFDTWTGRALVDVLSRKKFGRHAFEPSEDKYCFHVVYRHHSYSRHR